MSRDDRGRVPFAIVAILLLVSSATIATTIAPEAPPDEPSVDVVVDRVEAEQQTALRRAVRSAAGDAANEPVIEPANTTLGRAIGETETFRASLRLRIYVAAREQFEEIERRRGDVVATTELDPVDDTDVGSVRDAIERVEIEATGGNGTALTARVHNVTTTVRRGDRVVNEYSHSPRVTVASPVLALHDRVTEYDRRLNADVTQPGLEQRLTAVLNAAGWARGYAQYGGGPIGNVISNDHVEITTNAALLDVQRATIGTVDQDGLRGLHTGVGKLALQEYMALSPGSSPYLERVLDRQSVVPGNDIEGVDVPARDEPMTVGINRTAEDVFLVMLREDHSAYSIFTHRPEDVRLESVVDDTYSANARLSTRVLSRSGGPPSTPDAPGEGWKEVASSLDESVSISPVASSGPSDGSGDWHTLDAYSRKVVTDYERTTTWAKSGDRTKTRSSSREVTTVQIRVEGAHAPGASGPDNPIRGVHERGAGPLDGPNLAAVESKATERLLDDRGGKETVAKRAVAGTLDTAPITISGERPDGLREWLYRDLADLREEVRAISVEVDRRDVGTFTVNPPGMLEEKLEDRRAELVDAPATYDGVADRARVAVRSRYLTLVGRALEARASDRADRRDELGDALADANAGSIDDLQRSVHATVEDPRSRKPALDGPGGPVHLRVDAAPAYLERQPVSEKVPAAEGETTLATRNVNVFSLPYGEAINGIIEGLLSGPARTDLGTAARTLRSSEDVGVDDTIFRVGETTLTFEDIVQKRVGAVESHVVATLRNRNAGEGDLDHEAIVEAGLARWDGPADRAIALENGSAATAILDVAEGRASLTAVERDRLALVLDRSIRTALSQEKSQPESKYVEDIGETVKSETASAIRDVVEEYDDEAIEKVSKGKISVLPNGLPLAPVPGYWYATTNVWHVQVEGEYARFGVRASRGRPSAPGAGLLYARDGGNATLDVDGDGRAERLGSSRRVQFDASAKVVVVVPPGGQGVGDVSGERDERSQGWPLHPE